VLGGVTSGAITPTQSGNFDQQVLTNMGLGGALGGALSSFAASQAAQEILKRGGRLTLGQGLPFGGPGLERILAETPLASGPLKPGLDTARNDAQKIFYKYMVEGTGLPISNQVGAKGMKDMNGIIGNAYERSLQNASLTVNNNDIAALQHPQFANLPGMSGFGTALQTIRQSVLQLPTDQQRQFQRIARNIVFSKFLNNPTAAGSTISRGQLAGTNGVISRLRNAASSLYQNPNTRALGDQVKALANAVEDNANFGSAQGKQQFQNLRKAYAKYKTFEEASGRRADLRGFIDPDDVLETLHHSNPSAYVRGDIYGGELQHLAENMTDLHYSKVARRGSTTPIGHMPERAAGAASAYGALLAPMAAGGAAAGAFAGYNPASMSMLRWLAMQQAGQVGARAGGVAGQAANEMQGTPPAVAPE
jgi:hypothetical protein